MSMSGMRAGAPLATAAQSAVAARMPAPRIVIAHLLACPFPALKLVQGLGPPVPARG
jgi:hypothetical protein